MRNYLRAFLRAQCCKSVMKTKAICIILLTFLSFLRASSHSCVCSPPQSLNSATALVTAAAIDRTLDVCTDCGHTKSCCFEQQDLELAGSDIKAIDIQVIASIEACLCVESKILPKETAGSRFLNKAPPWSLVQTPFSLHQKLVV